MEKTSVVADNEITIQEQTKLLLVGLLDQDLEHVKDYTIQPIQVNIGTTNVSFNVLFYCLLVCDVV